MHQWFPIKWTTWDIIKSSTTSVTRGQYSRRSRNTWWFHYDMVKKSTVEFSRDNLEDNPHPRGPVTITTQETIARFLQYHCRQKSTECYIAARCQLVGSQSSLDLIRNGFSTTSQGRVTIWVSLAICDHR